MEGGMRVPMIARWPGQIPAGKTCDQLATTMDVLPTFCRLAGAKLPEKKIDGHDMGDLLMGKPDATSAYEAFYYYRRRQLQAIRVGDLKYHLPLENTFPNWTTASKSGKGRPARLVQVEKDRSEKVDVSQAFPGKVKEFEALAKRISQELGNEGQSGQAQRAAHTLEKSSPLRKDQ